jgi:hypothetical protein
MELFVDCAGHVDNHFYDSSLGEATRRAVNRDLSSLQPFFQSEPIKRRVK